MPSPVFYPCGIRALLVIVWLASDLAVFAGAYALAYFARVGWIFSSDVSFGPYMTTVALVAPVWLVALVSTRTFTLMRKQMSIRTLLAVAYSCTLGLALFALAYFFLFGHFFSRLLLLQAWVGSIAGVWAWHLAFGFAARSLLRRSPPAYPTLIIGATREAARLIRALQQKSPLRPVAVLDSHAGKDKDIHGVPVIGRLHKLDDLLARERITHLIQCSDLEHALNFVTLCQSRGITYMLLPSVLGVVGEGAQERVDMIEGHPVTIVERRGSVWGWLFR